MPVGGGKYATTNSGPATGAWLSATMSPVGALSPPPFPLEDATQGLTARGAAKLLTGAAPRRREVVVTARPLAAKKCAIPRWALALAGRLRRGAVGLRGSGERVLGGGGLATFGTATAIPPGLSLPFLPAIGGLPIVPAGAAAPPAPSRDPAFGTAISGVGMGGMKGLLTALEQTPSLPRPTSPLTGCRFAASWCWAQGSCQLPTAKPRMRSPYLRSEAPSGINSALVGVRHSSVKPICEAS
jgi:hypothetical protein